MDAARRRSEHPRDPATHESAMQTGAMAMAVTVARAVTAVGSLRSGLYCGQGYIAVRVVAGRAVAAGHAVSAVAVRVVGVRVVGDRVVPAKVVGVGVVAVKVGVRAVAAMGSCGSPSSSGCARDSAM